jgi:hypothetical protein
MRPTDHRLYGIILSPEKFDLKRPPPQRILFVDESNAPIAQCNFQGVCQRD